MARPTQLSASRFTLVALLLSGCGGSSAQQPPIEAVRVQVPSTPDWSPQRTANIARLKQDGFTVARSLPEGRPSVPRPTREIAGRLMALKGLFLRTVIPEADLSEQVLQAYMERNGLTVWLTPAEREIWNKPRSQVAALHGDSIGWRLENIWALAWALGYGRELSYAGGMVGPEQIDPIFREFTPEFGNGRLDAWLGQLEPRTAKELVSAEDLFYCAHNAVRSAQLGEPTVPDGFHPVGDGGIVHERRHVLSWILSPGVSWDETDLSS